MSRHHKAAKWASKSKPMRERLKPTLPRPCYHCGKPVLPHQEWDVAHAHDLARGGGVDVAYPAHSHCNRSAGGVLGAAIARTPKTLRKRSAREVKW